MIEEEALLSRFEEVDILALETSELTENFNDNFISLEGGEIDKLISFVLKNKLSTIFYYYLYPDIEYLLITDELLTRFDDDFKNSYQNQIEEYNNMINTYDFTKPLVSYVYTLYQGYFVGNLFPNDDFDGLAIVSGIEKLKELYYEYGSNEDRLEKGQKDRKDLLRRLKDYILNDPNFHKATNLNLRKKYRTYLRENNEEFRLYERKEHYNSVYFIEDLWKEYKAHKNDLENVDINLYMYIGNNL